MIRRKTITIDVNTDYVRFYTCNYYKIIKDSWIKDCLFRFPHTYGGYNTDLTKDAVCLLPLSKVLDYLKAHEYNDLNVARLAIVTPDDQYIGVIHVHAQGYQVLDYYDDNITQQL